MASAISLRTRQFMTNRLLSRRQMVVDVVHAGRATVPRSELRDEIAKLYKVSDPSTVLLYGFRTVFGGGRSSGFALIYDNAEAVKKYEPMYRLVRHGLATRKEGSRRQRKEQKNKLKKLRGTAKTNPAKQKKKSK